MRIALLLAANGAFMLTQNADGKTPTALCKPRFKVALEEAAQRYANRKPGRSATLAASDDQSATAVAAPQVLSPRGTVLVSDVTAAFGIVERPTTILPGVTEAAASKKAMPKPAPVPASASAAAVAVVIDDLIESMREPSAPTPAAAAVATAAAPAEAAPKPETPRNAPELRHIGALPCTLVGASGSDDRTVVCDFAGVTTIGELCAKVRSALALDASVAWHLAYVDNDGDEVILPDLDADGFTEVSEFAKQLKIHTD